MTEQPIRLTGPTDLTDAIPHLLGYHPTESSPSSASPDPPPVRRLRLHTTTRQPPPPKTSPRWCPPSGTAITNRHWWSGPAGRGRADRHRRLLTGLTKTVLETALEARSPTTWFWAGTVIDSGRGHTHDHTAGGGAIVVRLNLRTEWVCSRFRRGKHLVRAPASR